MEFVRHTVRLMGWAGLLLVPAALLVFGPHVAIGLAGGIVWALANVWVLASLMRGVVEAQQRLWWQQVGLWTLKLPVLYAVGACFLVSPWSSSLGFLVGFSLWFALLMVSAIREAFV